MTFNVPYSYFSILHYTLTGYSRNGKKTIQPRVKGGGRARILNQQGWEAKKNGSSVGIY